MIIEFFSLLALFISVTGWGLWIEKFFSIRINSVSLTVILGLALLSAISCSLSFFIPLNTPVELTLLLLSVIPYFSKSIRKNYLATFPGDIFTSGWFWCFFLILLLAGSYYSFRPDHFWYYVPTLNWLNKYGLITGVANIDWVLGQMSSLHILQAGLDEILDPFQRINIFITVIYLIYIFEKKSYLLLCFIPFYFLFIQTPSPDLPVVFFSLIVVNEICFNRQNYNLKILFIISAFVFTVKPVAFWLLLWIFIVETCLNRKKQGYMKAYIFSFLLVFLFFSKNYIASSMLVFPITSTQLDTYWSTDSRILEISNLSASYYTFDRHFKLEEINSLSFFQRLYYWLTTKDLQTIINIFTVVIVWIFGIFAFLKRKFIYIVLWIVILLKFFLIFSFSGQYRFMLDGIYPLLFILLRQLKINSSKLLFPISGFYLVSLFFISYPKFIKLLLPDFELTRMMKGFTKNALLRPENYVLEKYKTGKLGNLNFNISTDYPFNFDTPAPAFEPEKLKLYYRLNIFPQMKEPSHIHKGFYMKSLSPKEREKLRNIIEQLKDN
ncbi:MAG: hypothetical protein LBQ84_02975 [Flavobacteriaceae bacterium]|jgi:hypothetical protein|nr:hypothetical protein [Flavobacteriaceae bacterium]